MDRDKVIRQLIDDNKLMPTICHNCLCFVKKGEFYNQIYYRQKGYGTVKKTYVLCTKCFKKEVKK